MTFGRSLKMKLSTVGTIVSLSFAPAFLVYIHYFNPDESSLFFIGAKMVPPLYSLIFFFLFTAATLSKKHLVLKLTKQFYKKELDAKELEYLKKGDAYWMGATLLNTIILINMGLFSDDVTWALYSSVGWYVYFFSVLLLQILYGKLFYKPSSLV